jgi:hypothetical protein
MEVFSLTVSDHVLKAFAAAAQKQRGSAERWIRFAFRYGSRIPRSLLAPTIQRHGRLDTVLRSLEDERIDRHVLSGAEYLSMLSSYWIGGMHAAFWILGKRGLGDDTAHFKSVADDLALIRVGLEKHEIPKDWELEPLQMTALPPTHDESDFYAYDSDDKRALSIPAGLSARGSMVWQIVEGGDQTRLIERRELSDRILALAE